VKGKRIAILEARLGTELSGLVAQRGGIPFHAPALAEVPDLDEPAIAGLVRELEARAPRLAIFQTGVGTRALFEAADRLGVTPALLEILEKTIVVARGPKPSGALRRRGVRIDRAAAEPFTTHEILAAVEGIDLAQAPVLVQRYGSANLELDRALEARGAQVTEIPTYRWSLPQDTRPLERLIAALERREIDAVVLTNGEQVRNLFAFAERMGRAEPVRAALNASFVASIGPVASAALRAAQVKVDLEAHPPKLGALLSSLDSALAA
jgi:uroporphyrinogen-III synthase